MSEPSSGVAATVRALYQEGVPIHEIVARTGLSTGRTYYWIDHAPGPDGVAIKAPLPRRRTARRTSLLLPARRRALVLRLWRAAEMQVDEIEARLARTDGVAADAERDARTLAVLARVLRELKALEAASGPRRPADAENREDAIAFDLDTFRRELARRLEALREGENS